MKKYGLAPLLLATKIKSRQDQRVRVAEASQLVSSETYANLHKFSLSLTKLRACNCHPHLNIVLPELSAQSFFAGIRTAIDFGIGLAARLGVKPRIVVLRDSPIGPQRRQLLGMLVGEYGESLSGIDIVHPRILSESGVSPGDFWLATHWTTAHPLDVACRVGEIDRSRVAYLVQDYEAGFNAWSTDYALARSSLYAGFTMVVNSRPLYDYILKMDEISINPSLVFAPRLDVNRLERAVSVRSKGNTQSGPLVMFYGRPSKPRNLFSIGCASLMAANKILLAQGVAANFVSAGESHQSVRALNFELESRGKLSWDSYFALLAQTDVVLSLQHSPHPSHPPLDAVCSGAWAVTNEMDGTRAGLHPRLLTSLADPDALASSVVDAVLCAMSSPAVEYDAGFLDVLGRPFDSVLDDFAGHFDASAGA